MLVPQKQNKLIYWSFLSLFAYALIFVLRDAEIGIPPDNFFILIYISFGCLVVLYRKTAWKQDMPVAGLRIYIALLTWNCISLIWGMITATDYLDWKNTLILQGGGLALLIPLAMIAGFNILNGQRLFRFCMIIFLCSFLAIPVSLEYFDEIYPRLVTPIVIFVLFIPYYKNKNRFIILLVAIVSVAMALGWRANVLRILISFPFLLIYYFRRYISLWFLTLLQVAFFVVPLYFLVQGIKGDSIFAKNADAEFNITANGEEENLIADTRTDLYSEVLSDLYYSGDIWLGRGSNGKYKTTIYDDFPVISENERPNVEVGFLKILINTGVLGMLLYTILLGLAAYYGTWKSNNTLTKMLSMFLVSHWTMLFMENLIEYSMYFYFSWIVVGLCYSKKFRSMTDAEIKSWLRTPHKRNS